MPISGCHDLPLATFNLPSRNNLQNKPNSAATMSLPCCREATAREGGAGGAPREFFHTPPMVKLLPPPSRPAKKNIFSPNFTHFGATKCYNAPNLPSKLAGAN